MPESSEFNPQVAHVQHNGVIYDILDTAHETLTAAEISTGTNTEPKFISAKVFSDSITQLGSTDITANTTTHTLEITTSLTNGDGVQY